MNQSKKLALLGGDRVISEKFKQYNPIGEEEKLAALEVLESGRLSGFLGSWDPGFYGGDQVQLFERCCEKHFGTKHAVTFNSWTSGLIAAIGALDIEPGDEVIVPPWTMCATATSVLHWCGIPVFADIEDETFNLDPKSVVKKITDRTKAILAVDIFGHPANIPELRSICDKNGLKLILDSAQAPNAKISGAHSATLADIGGYSLNYHKHINTGEGGILITDDDSLAERARLIRNHGEAVVEAKKEDHLPNIIGYNFRLGEIEAAIGRQQLLKLDELVETRRQQAKKLNDELNGLMGLRVPITKEDYSHSFYIYALLLDCELLGIPKSKINEALQAEGLDMIEKYQNIHLLPIFQKKIAYGSKGFPWNLQDPENQVSYEKGICPVAEKLNDESFLGLVICLYELSDSDIVDIGRVFRKVWNNLDSLK